MEIQKIFSNLEDPEENLYSVLMDEDELALFSEFQKEFNSKKNETVEEEAESYTRNSFIEPMKKEYKKSRIAKDFVSGITGMSTGSLIASAKSKKGSHALIGAAIGGPVALGLARAHRKLTKKDKKAEELIKSRSEDYNKFSKQYYEKTRKAATSKNWRKYKDEAVDIYYDKLKKLKEETRKDLNEL